MEGIGSRFGRVSSRYGGSSSGPGPSASVFNGPVRKWKRKWVRSQPNDNATSGGRGNHTHHHQHQENKPSLLLCRWTRLPSTNNSDESPEPTKRKFRYTPVVVLEERKKEALSKTNGEAETRTQSRPLTMKDDMLIEKPDLGHANNDFNDEIKEASDDDQASFEDLNLQL